MDIKKRHFIDASEKNSEGYYEYYYEGDVYEITFSEASYSARSYIQTPTEISFLHKTVAGKTKLLMHDDSSIPYNDKNFYECIKYFKELGFQYFKILGGPKGYEPVQLEKFAIQDGY